MDEAFDEVRSARSSAKLLIEDEIPSTGSQFSAFYRISKRCCDFVGAVLALLLLFPLMVAIGIAIALGDGYPVLYRQRRVGYKLRPFFIYKFRSMRKDADEILRKDPELRKKFEQNFKLDDDPRITRIGALLRKTSLDELPQFFNVLIGNMSLVGPRPVVEKELALYGDDAWVFEVAQPGCTGLWQCSGRSSLEYDERVKLDVEYAEKPGLFSDFTIIVKTVFSVLRRHGAQ